MSEKQSVFIFRELLDSFSWTDKAFGFVLLGWCLLSTIGYFFPIPEPVFYVAAVAAGLAALPTLLQRPANFFLILFASLPLLTAESVGHPAHFVQHIPFAGFGLYFLRMLPKWLSPEFLKKNVPLLVPLGIYFGFSLYSSLSTVEPVKGAAYIAEEFVIAFSSLGFLQISQDPWIDLKKAITGLLICLAPVALFALALYWFKGDVAVRPFFVNNNYFSGTLVILLPFFLHRFQYGSIKQNKLGILAIPVLLILIFHSAMAILASMLISAYYFLPKRRVSGFIFLLPVIFLTTIFVINLSRGPEMRKQDHRLDLGWIDNILKDFSLQERLLRWEYAFEMTAEKPVSGIGSHNYRDQFKDHVRDHREAFYIAAWFCWCGGAHSEIISRLAERGIPATLGYLAFWVLLMIKGFKKTEKRNGILAAAMLSVVAWSIHGLGDDLSTSSLILALIFLLAGLVWNGSVPMKMNTDK